MSGASLVRSLAAASLVALSVLPLAACSGENADDALDTTDEDLGSGLTADRVTNDMLDAFWDGSRGEFRGGTTSYWINAQAFDAVLDAVERTHEKEFTHWPMKIRNGNHAQYGGWLTPDYRKTYFDDVTWMTIALIRAHDLSSGADKARYLDDAEAIFDFVMAHAKLTVNGQFAGLWWDTAHDSNERATASNFGPVIAAARLYERTKQVKYQSFASGVYAYWHANMVERQNDGTDFVLDSIQSGKKERQRFVYNNGLGIGAALAMADIAATPAAKTAHMNEAHAMAAFLIKHETHENVITDFAADGVTETPCTGDGAMFKGIAYRYLAQLYLRDTSHADYYTVLHSSAHAIIAHAYDSAHKRFGSRWDVTSRAEDSKLAANASAVMAINIFAELPQPK
jgi:predicted alpha-1,6-mannanase (GH76 family)